MHTTIKDEEVEWDANIDLKYVAQRKIEDMDESENIEPEMGTEV